MSSVGFYIDSFEVEIYSTFITLVSFSTGANVSPCLFTIFNKQSVPVWKITVTTVNILRPHYSKSNEENVEIFFGTGLMSKLQNNF